MGILELSYTSKFSTGPRAAVLERPHHRFALVEVGLDGLYPGEVMVEMGATGVCHSDISVFNATLPNPFPVVLGHEGAGTVVQVGENVTNVRPGDRVVLAWLAQCGACFYCLREQPSLCEVAGGAMTRGTLLDGTTRFRWQQSPVYHMAGLGTFSQRCVVPSNAVVKVADRIDIAVAALIGCGVLSGVGAAVNTARVAVGDAVAV